jgi:ELWxxDGT repeat protein
LFFTANDGVDGEELWKSDGTAAGTVIVKDIRPGSAGSNPSDFVSVKGELFFTANDGNGGGELWKSDGTTAGTVLVKLINSNYQRYNPYVKYLTNVNGTLYFSADDNVTGFELWKSDGPKRRNRVQPVEEQRHRIGHYARQEHHARRSLWFLPGLHHGLHGAGILLRQRRCSRQ